MISTRRAFLRFLRGAIALASISAALPGATVAHAQQARGATTTVILVRHAEKAAEPAADPPLTSAGEARARALLEAVRDAGVTAIITTDLLRTKATAQPAAAVFGITPEIVPARAPNHVQDVV